MKFTSKAVQTIAECFSRNEHLTIEFAGEPTTHLWCEQCQELSTFAVQVQGISTEAVYDLGEMTACTIHDTKAP